MDFANIFNIKSKRIEPFNDMFSNVRIDNSYKKQSLKKMNGETRNLANSLRGKIRSLLERIHNKEKTIDDKMDEVDTEINRREKQGKHNEIIEMLNTLINGLFSIVEQMEKYKGNKVAWGDSPKNKTKLKSKRTKTKRKRATPHPPSYSPPKSNEGRAGSPKKTKSKSKSKRTKSKRHTLNMWNPNHIRQYLKAHNILNEITRSQHSNAVHKLSLQDVKPKYKAIIFRILARQDKKNRKNMSKAEKDLYEVYDDEEIKPVNLDNLMKQVKTMHGIYGADRWPHYPPNRCPGKIGGKSKRAKSKRAKSKRAKSKRKTKRKI